MTKVKILTGSNYTRRTLLRSELSKEGDRAIDQITVDLPKNETVGINDKLYCVQDFVEVDDLSLLLNFQLNVKDESGTFNHGSATAIQLNNENSSSMAPGGWDEVQVTTTLAPDYPLRMMMNVEGFTKSPGSRRFLFPIFGKIFSGL